MNVPFFELKPAYAELQTELDEAYRRVMDSGWYTLGAEVDAFEREFAAYCGAAACVGVANGLDALSLILEACGVGAGDEVIVPANTFIATWLSITHVGARPVPVEPDPATFNLDVLRVAEAITPRTRAIVAVHLYGQPADMRALRALADSRGLILIEDAAQAHGARCGDRKAGNLGHAAAWSFYPTKNLGAFGDAGAVTTSDPALADHVRMLRNYGSRVKYQNEIPGRNSRLDPLQAAFLRVKLAHLDAWNERRKAQAGRYLAGLAQCAEITLPVVPDWAAPVWHLFVIRSRGRDEFQKRLSAAGIGTLIHYPVPPHLSGAYARSGWRQGSFPITESLASEVVSLPIGPHLSVAQQDYVIANIIAAQFR
ncbi:MAG: DegT/DnrJ/EryC1/StrS family aminotransferase [Thermoflexales bacterium]